MKLSYDGYLRRLQGSGMAFKDFHVDVEIKEEMIGKMETTAVPDTYLKLLKISEESLEFELIFFDKPEHYILSKGETITYKKEGNAWGAELKLYISE